MPTPSEQRAEDRGQKSEWAAKPAKPPRSVFGNYSSAHENALFVVPPSGGPAAKPPAGGTLTNNGAESAICNWQSAIDLAIARSFLYRFLAKAYEDPTPEGWHWLCDAATQQSLHAAWNVVRATPGSSGDPPAPLGDPPSGMGEVSHPSKANCSFSCAPLVPSGESPDGTGGSPVLPGFTPDAFNSFCAGYVAAFGHAARGRCPLNEIEYGDLKADPLFQPHRLADLGAFYRAFGLDVADDADERHDHICLELEFLCVLAAKEAYALEQQLEAEELSLCRDAQKKFLREHLGRWTPAFTRRLAAMAGDTPLGALAGFTRAFLESECARFGVSPGSEDLLLRTVDESAEGLCNACGAVQLPPGALAPAEATA